MDGRASMALSGSETPTPEKGRGGQRGWKQKLAPLDHQRMDLSPFLLVLFLSYLFACQNGVEGGRDLSVQEDLELENQLKFLNKPAVKTIETEYGDIYDCVDFYNQPAFDHPLLKNHSFYFEMKPTTLFESKRDQVHSEVRESAHVKLKDGGCPVGTVPIRRITKEDLIAERNASNIASPDEYALGAHYAVVRTKAGIGEFNGAGAKISLHNPKVSRNQYSAARLKVQNGLEEIQTGWRVDPGLYGDTRTRSFICVDAGQFHCFNTRCPGFVIVRSDFYPDFAHDITSKYRVPVYSIEQYIQRDIPNGNWWLLVGHDKSPVGFWPKRIFTTLADSASNVELGGKVYSPPGTSTPEMGSGQHIDYSIVDTLKDAFFCDIEVVNDSGKWVDAFNTNTFNDIGLYGVKDREIF